MKQVSIVILAILSSHLSVKCQDSSFKPSYSATFDSSKGFELLRQCSRSTPRGIKAYWTPARNDIQNLETNLKIFKETIARECCIYGARPDSLQRFAFQYTGIIIKGKKYIYINAFPFAKVAYYKEHNRDPAMTPVIVCDGGRNYWGVLFDPETKEFNSLSFNGEA